MMFNHGEYFLIVNLKERKSIVNSFLSELLTYGPFYPFLVCGFL